MTLSTGLQRRGTAPAPYIVNTHPKAHLATHALVQERVGDLRSILRQLDLHADADVDGAEGAAEVSGWAMADGGILSEAGGRASMAATADAWLRSCTHSMRVRGVAVGLQQQQWRSYRKEGKPRKTLAAIACSSGSGCRMYVFCPSSTAMRQACVGGEGGG
ncbi:hypothetical protein JB92DRAFT_2826208 [Gautieria morchelliformis]|nr:hypothetical protein JB92DRAFT_2826208 [Gautieria morchelliformis]